jgi:hypothetical protein
MQSLKFFGGIERVTYPVDDPTQLTRIDGTETVPAPRLAQPPVGFRSTRGLGIHARNNADRGLPPKKVDEAISWHAVSLGLQSPDAQRE